MHKRSDVITRLLQISAILIVVATTAGLVYLHWEPVPRPNRVVYVRVEEGSLRIVSATGEIELATGDQYLSQPGHAPTVIRAKQPPPEEP